MYLKSESYTYLFTRTETGGFEQCSQYVVDWNLVLNGTQPLSREVGELKIKNNQLLLLKNSSTSDWEVGACTDGWEYDTENFHRSEEKSPHDPIFHLNRSAVSDLNWVCDDSWIPAFSQVG